MKRLLAHFSIENEKEDGAEVIRSVEQNVLFKGTNLWILVFAIFIASLGLNVNSTAVVIGAMLVSPLMGPIMGLGLGMAINDLALLRESKLDEKTRTEVAEIVASAASSGAEDQTTFTQSGLQRKIPSESGLIGQIVAQITGR